MNDIYTFINELKNKSEKRFNEFEVENIDSIEKISDKAYLEKPTWLGGDKKFVCLFVDLNKSSKESYRRQPQTMAKIYDYFTQNIVDILNHPAIGAKYIDIKGDGAFGIFEGEKASYRALYCAITFKTMFEQIIRNKFDTDNGQLKCKFGIHKDKVLVKKLGKRGDGNYNEVWAGRLVNNASKLANQSKNLPIGSNNSLPILISEQVYSDFRLNKEYGFYHCCNNNIPLEERVEMFKEFNDFSDETLGNKFYYTNVLWCKNCANNYIELI